MALTWKYTNVGKSTKNHGFSTPTTSSAVCGYFIPWYQKPEWRNNPEGLATRESCKRCLRVEKVLNSETPLNLIPRTSPSP